MKHRVLFVDDEANILAAFQRVLRNDYDVVTAASADAALELLRTEPPFAAIVSDMNMPGTNGVELLARAKALAPDTVRLMLTGRGELAVAMDALAKGSIFRFLTKPSDSQTLKDALGAAVRQFQLQSAERELLEKTLRGSVQVLVEILSLADNRMFGRCTQLRDRAQAIGRAVAVPDPWLLEVAAMLSPIGYVAIPPVVMVRARHEQTLSGAERDMLARVPETGSRLLRHIPRLEEVAEVVRLQHKNFDGTGFPSDAIAGAALPFGARLLRILGELELAEAEHGGIVRAFAELRKQRGKFDPELLEVAERVLSPESTQRALGTWKPREVSIDELRVGLVTAVDIVTTDGAILVRGGNAITPPLLERLRNFAETVGIRAPILVRDAETVGAADALPVA